MLTDPDQDHTDRYALRVAPSGCPLRLLVLVISSTGTGDADGRPSPAPAAVPDPEYLEEWLSRLVGPRAKSAASLPPC